MARKFVRGGDVRYHALTSEQRQQRDYSGHYFGMVLEDGTDKVSLENAVGRSKYVQLWKAASFDAMWHFEMRGIAVDDADNEVMHGTGASKQNLVQDPDSAQRDLNIIRESSQQAIRSADAELTEPSTATGKNSYTELNALAPATPADYARERALLLDGLAYANDHLNNNNKGKRDRVTRWLTAAQAVIDRDGNGPNVQLAAHVLEQMRKVIQH